MAKISILMNCFNGDKYLKEAIDCVMSQTYKDWEIIFWDNQSTDNSAQIAKSYNDKRIKYYYAQKHTSLYEGRSCALKYCNGDYLAFLDCDDIWLSEKLEKQITIFQKKSDVVLVHTNTIFFNSDTNKERISNNKKKISGYIFRQNLIDYQFSLETVMVRMDIVHRNKLDFGKRFNMIGDRDFLSTVCFFGQVYYIDEVLGKWRIHNNNFSKSLHSDYPKELKYMYLRLKKRFKRDFTRETRVNIYNEIAFREALNLFHISGKKVRKKLNKVYVFNLKSLILRILSFFPKKIALYTLNILRRAS